MRPLLLEVKGFTSFRASARIDFADLSLFAITGPTGSGKSSLMDAICYALYGQVPRVGRNIKELISKGEERLRVALEFSRRGERYRIIRSTARCLCERCSANPDSPPHRPPLQVQLERLQDLDWVPEEDRAEGANRRIEAILGLDFEGFTRSVLLPQGQFHLFLAGEPKERRRVLRELLRLDLYEAVMRLANSEALQREQEAAGLKRRLMEDFVGITEEALVESRRRLEELQSKAEGIAALVEAVRQGLAQAQGCLAAGARLNSARREFEACEKLLLEARATFDGGVEEMRLVDEGLKKVEEDLAESAFQPELHRRLQLARVPLREHERAASAVRTIQEQAARQERIVEESRRLQEVAQEALSGALEALQDAELKRNDIRQRHAAVLLRRDLKPGDACPVCSQQVAVVPPIEHIAVSEAENAYKQAKMMGEAAAKKVEAAVRKTALAEQGLATVGNRLVEAQQEVARWQREGTDALGSPVLPARSEVEKQWMAQEEAKQRHDWLESQRGGFLERRSKLALAYRKAQEELAGLEATAGARRTSVEQSEREVSENRGKLVELSRRWQWEETLEARDDARLVSVMETMATAIQKDSRDVQQDIGAATANIQRIESGIKQVSGLRDEERDLASKGRLARDLATLLRADRFQAFIEEAALRLLAQGGSAYLLQVSSGRYEFAAERQEFLVVDHWNADEKRSVRTLSGGETFLASLALALALAEQLPEVGAGSNGASLESLFLDEGFSNLDIETRNVVADALERLHQDGTRMVGVITHDRELAERMPSRIIVHKTESGSSVSIE